MTDRRSHLVSAALGGRGPDAPASVELRDWASADDRAARALAPPHGSRDAIRAVQRALTLFERACWPRTQGGRWTPGSATQRGLAAFQDRYCRWPEPVTDPNIAGLRQGTDGVLDWRTLYLLDFLAERVEQRRLNARAGAERRHFDGRNVFRLERLAPHALRLHLVRWDPALSVALPDEAPATWAPQGPRLYLELAEVDDDAADRLGRIACTVLRRGSGARERLFFGDDLVQARAPGAGAGDGVTLELPVRGGEAWRAFTFALQGDRADGSGDEGDAYEVDVSFKLGDEGRLLSPIPRRLARAGVYEPAGPRGLGERVWVTLSPGGAVAAPVEVGPGPDAIEVELREAGAAGRPLAGVRLVVRGRRAELASDEWVEREGRTDARGVLRATGLRGPCTLTSPVGATPLTPWSALSPTPLARAWRRTSAPGSLERFKDLVRKVELAEPTWDRERVLAALLGFGYDTVFFRAFLGASLRGDAPVPRPSAIPRATPDERYVVSLRPIDQPGDTLAGAAARAGQRAAQVALLEWGAADPERAELCMGALAGCRRVADGQYTFDAGSARLHVAEAWRQEGLATGERHHLELHRCDVGLDDALTRAEVDELSRMVPHETEGPETGVARDATGRGLAAGHVVTGLAAGLHRDRDVLGLSLDNLQALTLAGDLGQVACRAVDEGRPPASVQVGLISTEATDAELVGDVDGLLLGEQVSAGVPGRVRVSELLERYTTGDPSARLRGGSVFDRFQRYRAGLDVGRLRAQTRLFASLYLRRVSLDRLPPLGAFAQDDAASLWPWCDAAVDAFLVWLDTQHDPPA